MNTQFWAITLALLSLQYASLATFWTHIFNRDVVRHGTRAELGYRIGWGIHWRLPLPGTMLVLGIGALGVIVPKLVSTAFARWLLGFESVILTILWLWVPPGQKLSIVQDDRHDEQVVMRIVPARRPFRAMAVFLLFGLIPAMLIGLALYKLVG